MMPRPPSVAGKQHWERLRCSDVVKSGGRLAHHGVVSVDDEGIGEQDYERRWPIVTEKRQLRLPCNCICLCHRLCLTMVKERP